MNANKKEFDRARAALFAATESGSYDLSQPEGLKAVLAPFDITEGEARALVALMEAGDL